MAKGFKEHERGPYDTMPYAERVKIYRDRKISYFYVEGRKFFRRKIS